MAETPGDVVVGTLLSGPKSAISEYMWVFWIVLGVVIFGLILFLIANAVKKRKRWDVTIRVRQEDPQYKKIYLDPVVVMGKRVVLSNGLRMIYLQKAILGKKLFPLLNYHTRPGVYDIIITADNRIFTITGIDGIDEIRKTLKVGIRYPGIDYSLEEVNRDHAKLNDLDRKGDLLGIVKAASVAVIAIVIMVIFIVGIQKYSENKKFDAAKSQSELALIESLKQYQLSQNEQTASMIILIDKLKEITGEEDLRSVLNEAIG